MRRKKGQSILEYVIVLTVIIAAIAYAARSFLSEGINAGFTNAGAAINFTSSKLPTQ